MVVLSWRSAATALALVVLSSCNGSGNHKPLAATTSEPAAAAADAATEAAPPRVDYVQDARTWPDVKSDWCLEGWRGLDEATCYFVPEGFDGRDARLLVYLSGIVPPSGKSPQKENVQRIVASAAKKANVVAMLPRGRRGIGPTDAKDWWAWPTSPADYQAHAREIVEEWLRQRAKLEAALFGDRAGSEAARPEPRRFTTRYLAGSSSGAYFLAALALSGVVDAEFDGYAATSGGATGLGGQGSASSPARQKHPFYIGYAEGDPTSSGPKALGALLSSAGWPVRVAAHSGGHGAREEYLLEAFAFFESIRQRGSAGRNEP